MKPRGPQLLVTMVFGTILLSAGAIQLGLELSRGQVPQMFELFSRMPSAANLRAYEQRLEDESRLAGWLRPWMQYGQFLLLRDLGEKALAGRNGWYFYKPGVEFLTRRHALPPAAEDPVAAIVDFRDRLAARGIHLVVLPTPNKESIYPEQLVRRTSALSPAPGEPTRSVLRRLRSANVDVVDLFDLFAREKAAVHRVTDSPLYLAQDSHWSPAGVDAAARTVAQHLVEGGWIKAGIVDYHPKAAPTVRLGDVLRMLNVPQIETHTVAERIPTVRVIEAATAQPYRDDPAAEILVLGDSFLRIYEQDEPGAAGFVAHLSKELKRPVTSLISDGGASTLVRQELHRRPALLRNKRVVVWEFVERDLRLGTEGWQKVPLPDVPPGGQNERVHPVPRPLSKLPTSSASQFTP